MAIIEKLHILRFRNLDNQYLELNKNINLFIGSNGQGKTNLIESIYYLGHNRSFKTKNIKDVVPFEKDFLQIIQKSWQDFEEDVRVVLFVVLSAGITLDEALEKALRTKIRSGASPRHVPARIVAVADIPRTKSGKITELAVRDIVHGREIKNKEALANPEALDLFRNIPKLQS